MIIYSPTITNRLRYICDFIGNEILGQPFTLTSSLEEFSSTQGARINYSEDRIKSSDLWIHPHGLLLEKNIRQQEVNCFEENGTTYFFKTHGDLLFDIFAASFYLMSRYEEYLPHEKDMYGRYAHTNSIAYKENFLRLPLVNIWICQFREKLMKRYPSVNFKQPVFSFVPTYDIDEAFSFRYKQWWRTTGGTLKDLLKVKTSRLMLRKKVLIDKNRDPFDSYDWMDDLHERYGLNPHYFFLVAEKTGKYDKNILPDKEIMKKLIRQHAENYPVGIHPSWHSGDKPGLLESEIKKLEEITGKKIISSRQHFIRFTLPATYRRLIDVGIKKDYSMGYGSINGFRASVTVPFYWYDLEKDKATTLELYPFCFMDANALFEESRTTQGGLDQMKYYYKKVKSVNGMMITIWHNTFLGTDELYAGWREVYELFINELHTQGDKRF